MNTAQRILLFITFFLVIQACSEVSQSESSDIRLPSLTANLFVEPTDSTIPQKLPLLSGTWKGIGKDQGRAFTWMVTNDQLEGNYQANKKIKEDYSKMFRFRVQDGVLCCFPGNYGGKCGTPDGTYHLIAQTDSSYTFEAERHPLNKTISTLQFSFEGQNRMGFQWKHDYGDADYLDYHIVRRFQKKR